MRKYDKKNKIYMLLIAIVSIVLIVIFSFFINKVITNGKLVYVIEAGSIMYDKDKNLIKIEEDATLKVKWNDMYYLMYKDELYILGKNAVIYNPSRSQMNLYGRYYEVTKSGEDKVIIHDDETLVNVNESKFYKIADRRYLLIDNEIKSKSGSLNTSNYLLVDIDKSGNANVYNNSINLKTFSEMNIVCSTYEFDVANELLKIDNEEINLKKIIGSSNEYIKEENIKDNNSKDDKDDDGSNNGNNNVGNNPNNNNPNNNNNNNPNNNKPKDEPNKEEIKDNDKDDSGNKDDDNHDEIIKATKTTSIISVSSSVGYINIDYVVYDPLDEYESVYVEIYDSNNSLVSVSYFDKSTNNLVIPGLRANVRYDLVFKYNYVKDNKRVVETFDEARVMMGSPKLGIKITKVTSDRIYYNISLDKDYKLDRLSINLKSNTDNGLISLKNSISSDDLNSKNIIEGYFQYEDIGRYVELYLSDAVYKGFGIDSRVSYKIAMP